MATLTVQTIDRKTGLVLTKAAASAGGDDFPNDGNVFLVVENTDAGAHTVTCDAITNCNLGYDHNEPDAVSVAAGDEAWFGPFPVRQFGDSVAVTYDAVTGVNVAAVRL